MPLDTMSAQIQRQRRETRPSARRTIHRQNVGEFFVSTISRGADKQPGTTLIGRRQGAGVELATLPIDACHDLNIWEMNGPNLQRPLVVTMTDENYAALREAVLPAQPEEPRATNDRAKGPTRGGRRVVIVAGNAQQHALQDVVG